MIDVYAWSGCVAILSLGNEQSTLQDEHTYKYKVKMTCTGCSGAVTRVLKRAQDEGRCLRPHLETSWRSRSHDIPCLVTDDGTI